MARTRFKLQLVGPDEDRPRIVRGYGRACGGEFALVLRPSEGRGALVLVRKDGATFWKADVGDSPEKPTTPCTAADAITLVKTEQKAVPKPGPITLRGRWTGVMHCDGEAPRLELYRKLAAYGTLTITSHGAGGWAWSFARTAKWFGKEETTGETGIARLADAMERGVLGAMQLVKEACSFRDTTRRAEVDPTWAEKHPPRQAPERPDPTDRLREPKPRKRTARPKPATSAPPPPTPPSTPAPTSYEERFAHAMRTSGPGNWRALTELYASPDDARTQRELGVWLDKYARTAEDGLGLLDGRDNAGEAGIRADDYDEIARRLHFEPIVVEKPKRTRKARPSAQAAAAPRPAASDDQAAKDAQILALFKAALAEESA